MPSTTLTPEQEALVQEITQEVVRAAPSDIADIVRTVVSKSDRDVFGQTELTVRAAGQLGFSGDHLAAERLALNRLRQLLGPYPHRRHPLLDGLGQPEKSLDAADDFGLFERGETIK